MGDFLSVALTPAPTPRAPLFLRAASTDGSGTVGAGAGDALPPGVSTVGEGPAPPSNGFTNWSPPAFTRLVVDAGSRMPRGEVTMPGMKRVKSLPPDIDPKLARDGAFL